MAAKLLDVPFDEVVWYSNHGWQRQGRICVDPDQLSPPPNHEKQELTPGKAETGNTSTIYRSWDHNTSCTNNRISAKCGLIKARSHVYKLMDFMVSVCPRPGTQSKFKPIHIGGDGKVDYQVVPTPASPKAQNGESKSRMLYDPFRTGSIPSSSFLSHLQQTAKSDLSPSQPLPVSSIATYAKTMCGAPKLWAMVPHCAAN